MIIRLLCDDEIELNFQEFVAELSKCTRPGISELIDWIKKTDWKYAPSSTKYHLSCPGGLVKHSLNVLKRLRKLLKEEGLLDKYPEESIILVALLHDLCKVNYYEMYSKNVKNKDTGKWEAEDCYKIKDDSERLIYGLHAENSIFLASRFINLSYEEQLAIRWHMGCLDWQDNNAMVSTMGAAYGNSKLAFLLHLADQMASYLDEGNNK